MADATGRLHFQHELQTLEGQALGALDLVISALDRTMEALHHQDIELASIVILDDDRLDGALPGGPPGRPVAAGAAGAGGLGPADRGGAPARDQARRAHGRPVREHREDVSRCRGTSRRSTGRRSRRSSRWADWCARRSSRPSRRSRCATSALAEDLVRQDEQVNLLNRECLSGRAVEIGTDEDRRELRMTMMLVSRAVRADRGQCGGHRRAGCVRRHGAVREFSDASHRPN